MCNLRVVNSYRGEPTKKDETLSPFIQLEVLLKRAKGGVVISSRTANMLNTMN